MALAIILHGFRMQCLFSCFVSAQPSLQSDGFQVMALWINYNPLAKACVYTLPGVRLQPFPPTFKDETSTSPVQ